MEKDKEGLIEKFKKFLNGEDKEKPRTSVYIKSKAKYVYPCVKCSYPLEHDGIHDVKCPQCDYVNLATGEHNSVISSSHIGYNEAGVLGEEHSGKSKDCDLCRKRKRRQ